jgi:hypothetical protein
MDIFKFGLRTVIGIIMPGTVLVAVFFYALWIATNIFASELCLGNILKEYQLTVIIVSFLASYFIGILMRLATPRGLENKSGEYLIRQLRKNIGDNRFEPNIENFKIIRNKLLLSKITPNQIKDEIEIQNIDNGITIEHFFRWIFAEEEFPYPTWQIIKFHYFHPQVLNRYMERYRDQLTCRGTESGSDVGNYLLRLTKIFFNYCKMVVSSKGKELGNYLIEEVQYAEALVRLCAGLYYGIKISIYILCALLFIQLIYNLKTYFIWEYKVYLIFTIGLLGVLIYMNHIITKNFRRVRHKEVDTVYEAFYLSERS